MGMGCNTAGDVRRTGKARCKMPLEVRMKADGTPRRVWYGRYEVNGKRFCDKLDVKFAGTPPVPFSLRAEGDGAYERSRAAAQAKLDSLVADSRIKHD